MQPTGSNSLAQHLSWDLACLATMTGH